MPDSQAPQQGASDPTIYEYTFSTLIYFLPNPPSPCPPPPHKKNHNNNPNATLSPFSLRCEQIIVNFFSQALSN